MKEEGKISNESSFICNVIKKNNKMNQLLFQIYSKKSWKKGDTFLEDEIMFKQFILNKEDFNFVDNKIENEKEFKKMKELCSNNRQLDITDFDDLLENQNLDWRNKFLD